MKIITKILLSIVLTSVCFYTIQAQSKSVDLMTKSVDFFNAGDLDKAIVYAEDAVTEVKKEEGQKSYLYTFMCNKRNFMYLNAGEIKKAKKGCNDNYILLSELIKTDNKLYEELYIESIYMLSYYYKEVGNYKAQDTLFFQLLDYYPDNTKERAVIYSNIALNYIAKGYSYKAEPLFLKAIEMYENTEGKDEHYATMVNNLGLVYYELGFYEKAEYYFNISLNVLKTIKNKHYKYKISTHVNINLANVYINQKKYDEAEKVLITNKKNIDKNITEYLYTIFTLGTLYMDQREIQIAKLYFNECLILCEKKKGKTNEIYYTTLNKLGLISILEKNEEKAEDYYNKSLQIIENNSGSNNITYIWNLGNLANLYYKQKKYEQALIYFEKVSEKNREQIQANFTILSEKEKYQYTKQHKADIEAYQNLAFDYYKEKPEIIGGVFNNLLFHKKLILFNTKSFKQLVENSNDTVILNTYYQLIDKKQEIANLFISINNSDIDILKTLQTETENIENELIKQINQKYLNNDVNFEFRTFKDIQNSLKENEAVIEFTHFQRYYNGKWVDTTYYCALVLQKNYAYPKFIFLGTEQELENILKNKNPNAHIATYIQDLYKSEENDLYKFIWQKIELFLTDAKQVYISPSGLVHNIAFACLSDSNNIMLKDKYNLNYVTNSTNIIDNKSLYFSDINNSLFFGGIEYELDSLYIHKLQVQREAENYANMRVAFFNELNRLILSYLPKTLTEIDSIAEIFSLKRKVVKIYTGKEANEENFYDMVEYKIDIIHIATHGYYYPSEKANNNIGYNIFDKQIIDNSMFRSGLFLAGAQNSLDNDNSMLDVEDGILTSYEISLLDLSSTKLVVLSACQTGLGDIKGNEGIVGLGRAFKIAGVDYLILSLWEIPSYQTMEFMILFYRNFALGQAVEIAFAKAQNDMSKEYKNSYFWAGFILVN